MAMRRFSRFACIDWSGAVSEFPPGLALAEIGEAGIAELIDGERRWSRQGILEWLLAQAASRADTLIGVDLSLGFPYVDRGAYFPEWPESPADARQLWALVDRLCADDPHLGANSFVMHADAARHFRHGRGVVGDLFSGGIGRLREVERHQRATKQANSWSCLNLVGAGQVGKSSLTGMRVMHRLCGAIPIWPFDPVPETGPLIVEIYTTMAARAAGLSANRSKIRDAATLASALDRFAAKPPRHPGRTDDHATDALLTAAWMHHAAADPAPWSPAPMTAKIAATEGWTFGVI